MKMLKKSVHVHGAARIGDWGRANLCKGDSLLHIPNADLVPTLYRNKFY